MHKLFITPLFAAALLVAGGTPAAVAQEPLTAPLPSTRIDPGTERLDGHTSRGCSFLWLRWC